MSIRIYYLTMQCAFAFSTACFSVSSYAATSQTWQGPYVGGYLGGSIGYQQASTNAGGATSSSYFASAADVGVVNSAGSWSADSQSGLFGIQAGHDWQRQHIIFGIAGDFGALPLSQSKSNTGVLPVSGDIYSVYTSVRTNWLFTLRGKLGYETVLRWPCLFYLTGGATVAQLHVNNNYSDTASLSGLGGSQTSENQIGWVAGAGLEVAAMGHTSLDIEYLYTHIPSVRIGSSISNTTAGFGIPSNSLSSPFSTTGSMNASIIRLGLNYRFDE